MNEGLPPDAAAMLAMFEEAEASSYEKRPIPSFEDYYADTNGNILDSIGARLTKTINRKSGYLFVSIFNNYNETTIQHVHVLVCTAFHGPRPDEDYDVCHSDDSKLNNMPSNLLWKTHDDNMRDSGRTGRVPFGIDHWQCRLSEKQVIEIKRRLKLGHNPRDIAPDYGVSRLTISDIKRGATWKS